MFCLVSGKAQMESYSYEVFSNEINKDLTLIEFWHETCSACVLSESFLAELKEAYKAKCSVGKINISEENNLIKTYNISKLPTFILFKNSVVLDRIDGYKKNEIEKMIRNHI